MIRSLQFDVFCVKRRLTEQWDLGLCVCVCVCLCVLVDRDKACPLRG